MAPELLRVRGCVLLARKNLTEAQRSLLHALELARHQGAKGWELRTATTLAELFVLQGRDIEARELLETIYRQFTEGLDTPDLIQARRLLQDLEHSMSSPTTSDERSLAGISEDSYSKRSPELAVDMGTETSGHNG